MPGSLIRALGVSNFVIQLKIMPRKILYDEKEQALDTFIYGGLAAFNAVCVVQLITLPKGDFDQALTIALYCFSVALPMLILMVVNTASEATHKYTIEEPAYSNLANIGGLIATIIGAISVFWHFSRVTGVIFLLSCIYCTIAHLIFEGEVEKVNKDDES